MIITYKDRKLEKICTDINVAQIAYGAEMAERIHKRICDISAYFSVEQLIENHVGRCHPLKNNRKGQYAMDLVHPYRLVFEKHGEVIQLANILEIVDYH